VVFDVTDEEARVAGSEVMEERAEALRFVVWESLERTALDERRDNARSTGGVTVDIELGVEGMSFHDAHLQIRPKCVRQLGVGNLGGD